MLLRHKFGILALIYATSIVATLATSLWCIGIYFQSAYTRAGNHLHLQSQLNGLRLAVRGQRMLLDPSAVATGNADVAREIVGRRNSLKMELEGSQAIALWRDSDSALEAERQYLASRRRSIDEAQESVRDPDDGPDDGPGDARDGEDLVYHQTDNALAQLGKRLDNMQRDNVTEFTVTLERVMWILAVNGVGGAMLCVAWVAFVRRWVGRPVEDLREATRRIGGGEFSHRIPAESGDELGMLAREVNQMCATILAMQTRLVEQERLAAAGEMVTRLAHNIRNPLGGLRGLAETTLQRHADDLETRECQQRIIDTVDRFESWLRDLQQSVAPMELQLQETDVEGLLDGIRQVLEPLAQRRGVSLTIEVDPRVRLVQVDPRHLEQAVVAVMTNAVQATPDGSTVVVRARPDEDRPGLWRLTVDDEGSGVPFEEREKIFEAYFTTKRDGHGLGLAMARKVVKLHGGAIWVDSKRKKGTRFTFSLPR